MGELSASLGINNILKEAVDLKASDVFLVPGAPISLRKNGAIIRMGTDKLMPNDTQSLIAEIYSLAGGRTEDAFLEKGDDDFAVAIRDLSRFRVCVYKQRGSLSAVIRIISFNMPDYKERQIPEYIMGMSRYKKGMVLVTGPASSGKSTTLACVIDKINHERNCHVITLEDPVEFLHRHDKSIISQREISLDSENYVTALRAALRQSPDVILLGEMRDYETISVAMTAAETGHLLFSTLHTVGAANAIDRIIDIFPPNQQRQIAVQLSMVLNAVVSQQLIPGIDGKLVPAFEIMTVTPAIRNMIRDNKTHQIEGLLYSAAQENMISMDQSILRLYKEGKISKESALVFATNPDLLEKKLL